MGRAQKCYKLVDVLAFRDPPRSAPDKPTFQVRISVLDNLANETRNRLGEGLLVTSGDVNKACSEGDITLRISRNGDLRRPHPHRNVLVGVVEPRGPIHWLINCDGRRILRTHFDEIEGLTTPSRIRQPATGSVAHPSDDRAPSIVEDLLLVVTPELQENLTYGTHNRVALARTRRQCGKSRSRKR